uniref:Uncharacterized protein n=1 Tax=Anguilla anguilla TaxID=7936 RepID=A0A0E9WI05_ANGAN
MLGLTISPGTRVGVVFPHAPGMLLKFISGGKKMLIKAKQENVITLPPIDRRKRKNGQGEEESPL